VEICLFLLELCFSLLLFKKLLFVTILQNFSIEILKKVVVDEIGHENVIQLVTKNGSN
jgi:hypothetical protein